MNSTTIICSGQFQQELLKHRVRVSLSSSNTAQGSRHKEAQEAQSQLTNIFRCASCASLWLNLTLGRLLQPNLVVFLLRRVGGSPEPAFSTHRKRAMILIEHILICFAGQSPIRLFVKNLAANEP